MAIFYDKITLRLQRFIEAHKLLTESQFRFLITKESVTN